MIFDNEMSSKMEEMANKIMMQLVSKIDETVLSRIRQLEPDFEPEEEAKKRFKRICQEVRGEIHSYYWNDGSERGIHLFSYKIEHPQFYLHSLDNKYYSQLFEVSDPSIDL